MKKFAIVLLCVFAAPAFATDYIIPISANDKQVTAVLYFVEQENAKIAIQNAQRAAQDPPLEPLPYLSGPIEYMADAIKGILNLCVIKHNKVIDAKPEAQTKSSDQPIASEFSAEFATLAIQKAVKPTKNEKRRR